MKSVSRVATPEDREYDRYLVTIETLRSEIASMRSEISTISLKMAVFSTEYHARAGALFTKRDRLFLSISEYEVRISRLRQAANPSVVEDEVREAHRERHERLSQEEEATRGHERAYEQEKVRCPLDMATEAELRKLYRDLAKRYHPDLARTEDEYERREAVMRKINAAFSRRDLDDLRNLKTEADIVDRQFEARSVGERLVWAIREVARLEMVLSDLKAEENAICASSLYAIWSRHEAGEPVIETLEADLEAEIVRGQDRLAALIETYRDLMETRA